MNSTELRLYLTSYISQNCLKDFCDVFFDLNIENLSGQSKSDKVREMVLWCQRHSKFDRLSDIISTLIEVGDLIDMSELDTLAFELGIDLDSFSGDTGKISRLLSLFIILESTRRFDELLIWIRKNRPRSNIALSSGVSL